MLARFLRQFNHYIIRKKDEIFQQNLVRSKRQTIYHIPDFSSHLIWLSVVSTLVKTKETFYVIFVQNGIVWILLGISGSECFRQHFVTANTKGSPLVIVHVVPSVKFFWKQQLIQYLSIELKKRLPIHAIRYNLSRLSLAL